MSFLALMRYSQETKAIKEPYSNNSNNSNNINNINNINEKSFYQKMKERIYLFYESYKKS
jgi:hypothetical protein